MRIPASISDHIPGASQIIGDLAPPADTAGSGARQLRGTIAVPANDAVLSQATSLPSPATAAAVASARRAPNYADNIRSVGSIAPLETLDIRYFKVIHGNGTTFYVWRDAVSLACPCPVPAGFKSIDGISFPVDASGHRLFDPDNTPAIVSGARENLRVAEQVRQDLLLVAETTNAFAQSVAALGGSFWRSGSYTTPSRLTGFRSLRTAGVIARGGTSVQPPRVVPDLGRKLDYFLGRGTGNAHNRQRSTYMRAQLARIGLPDNATTRRYLQDHLESVLNDPANIKTVQTNKRILRESLLMGPRGGLKFETVWEDDKLITGMFHGWLE